MGAKSKDIEDMSSPIIRDIVVQGDFQNRRIVEIDYELRLFEKSGMSFLSRAPIKNLSSAHAPPPPTPPSVLLDSTISESLKPVGKKEIKAKWTWLARPETVAGITIEKLVLSK